jgi:hypothetical protein
LIIAKQEIMRKKVRGWAGNLGWLNFVFKILIVKLFSLY